MYLHLNTCNTLDFHLMILFLTRRIQTQVKWQRIGVGFTLSAQVKGGISISRDRVAMW